MTYKYTQLISQANSAESFWAIYDCQSVKYYLLTGWGRKITESLKIKVVHQ